MSKHAPPPKPWKPGQSGNPKGRPPGRGQGALLRAAIEKDLPAIIAVLAAKAKDGDAQAARLLLERVLPPVKAVEEPTPLKLPRNADLAQQGRAVIEAVAAGDMAPGQGAAIMGAIGSLAKLIEAEELARRVTALEQATKGTSP